MKTYGEGVIRRNPIDTSFSPTGMKQLGQETDSNLYQTKNSEIARNHWKYWSMQYALIGKPADFLYFFLWWYFPKVSLPPYG